MRKLILALWLTALPVAAAADDIADFNAAVERASAHQRIALGYLRTGNADLAAHELEATREAWGAVTRNKRPAVFAGQEIYIVTMTDVSLRLVTATMLLDAGNLDAAFKSLASVRGELSKLRRSAGLYLLADCVLDANAAMDALMEFDQAPPDWNDAANVADLTARAGAYRDILRRCEPLAATATRTDPQFRRLVDGAQASLVQVTQAIAARDPDLLHRLLIELRSFDHLLAFRFG
jgi:hypothetical protein